MTAPFHAITTLKEIRAAGPCKYGWKKLLRHLGKTQADDEPLPLLTILESNGLDDALWCLRVKALDRLSRHFQAWCAEQMLHLFEAERPNDTRIRDQIAMLRNDTATASERDAALDAALDAARDAAWDAMRAAARAAARAAMRDEAWAAVRDAAEAAMRDAAHDSTQYAAWAAARAAQERQLRAMIGGAA